MYWASSSVCSWVVGCHCRFAATSLVCSLWLKSRASFWKYSPSRVLAQLNPGPQSLTNGSPGTADPVLIASCRFGELLPNQLPCGCVSVPDCNMPLGLNTRGPVPSAGPRIVVVRGLNADVP